MYKLSDYTVVVRGKDYIIHNTLYGNMVRVTGTEEKEYIDSIDELLVAEEALDNNEFLQLLIDMKFIVDENTNEQNIVNLRYLEYEKRTLNVIIIPTRQCNFDCPYCYEKHVNLFMEKDTYHNVIEMLVKIINTYAYSSVNIGWFGGEPTLEIDNICSFMNTLRARLNNRIAVYGQMTSNGYLLNYTNLKRLVDAGISSYQITIDGLKITHDKTRVLKGNQPSWVHIINNLCNAKKSKLKFKIVIRTNFTKEMIKYANEWFDYLKNEFLSDKRFKLYFEAVKDLGGADKTYKFGEGEGKQVADLLKLATDKELFPSTYQSWLDGFGMVCYAGKTNSLVVDYDGRLRKCTVILEDPINNVGKVGQNGKFIINEQSFSWWTTYEKQSECLSCKIYPLCYGKKCPACYPEKNYCNNLIDTYYGILGAMSNLYKTSEEQI